MTAFEAERRSGHNPEGNAFQKAISKRVAVSEMRELQELTLKRLRERNPEDKFFCSLVGAYTQLRESIRIERGIIKPGSRNVSVRELSAADQVKRISPRASRPTDYLRDAEATLARAQAMADPVPPADSAPK